MSAPTTSVPHYSSDRRREHPLRIVWRFRELLLSLVERNLKVKYQRSVIGFAWTLMNPVLVAGVLILVFGQFVRIPVPNYWALLLSGFFAWNFASQMLDAGASVLVEHAALRRAVAFPAEVLIFSAAVSRLVEFAIEMTLALTLIVIFHHGGVPPSLIMIPWLVTLLLLITVGLALAISMVAVFYYDVQHILPIVVLTTFYLSPVFYPVSMVPEWMRGVYFINPFAGLLTLFHIVVYEGRFPPVTLLLGMTAVALVIAYVGYAVFNRRKALFAEIV
jgi:lipopolysaccharide transport system permease protein